MELLYFYTFLYFSSNLEKFLAIISSNIFPFPTLFLLIFKNFNYTYNRPLEIVPQLADVHFLKVPYSLCFVFWIVSITISSSLLTFSSAVSHLYLISTSVFFFLFLFCLRHCSFYVQKSDLGIFKNYLSCLYLTFQRYGI